MSAFRPYVNEATFKYPLIAGQKSLQSVNSSLAEESTDAFEFLDLDELIAGKSQLSAVGLSITRFYTRMLVSQPFEVSRFLLQVGEWSDSPDKRDQDSQYDDYEFGHEYESSSDEEVDYFVDVRDLAHRNDGSGSGTGATPLRRKVKPSKSRDIKLFRPDSTTTSLFPEAIHVDGGPFIFGVMGAMADKEGVFSMWRALNASCLCRAATGVVKAWITSFLASFTGIPDPQFVDMLQTPDPMRLVLVGTAGCAITAALLTPLFMIRARLAATSMTMPDRPRSLRWSLIESIRNGQLVAPWWVSLPTMLAATVNHAVLATAPMFLWRYGSIDSFRSPKLYQFSQLGASLLGLVVTMPLETMASRAQLKACHPAARTLVIKPVDYQGILPTIWDVIRGNCSLLTLYRGWRSEVIGLLGEWGYDALDEGRPTQQERF